MVEDNLKKLKEFMANGQIETYKDRLLTALDAMSLQESNLVTQLDNTMKQINEKIGDGEWDDIIPINLYISTSKSLIQQKLKEIDILIRTIIDSWNYTAKIEKEQKVIIQQPTFEVIKENDQAKFEQEMSEEVQQFLNTTKKYSPREFSMALEMFVKQCAHDKKESVMLRDMVAKERDKKTKVGTK